MSFRPLCTELCLLYCIRNVNVYCTVHVMLMFISGFLTGRSEAGHLRRADRVGDLLLCLSVFLLR